MRKARARVFLLGAAIVATIAGAALAAMFLPSGKASAITDPRLSIPVVRLVTPVFVGEAERSFTGTVASRVQSNLGFRVAGKIVERLVNVGQTVQAGQPLMRIDAQDLRLTLTAKRNAVSAARASMVQLEADYDRYEKLVGSGYVSRQKYEQAKAAAESSKAQLAAAEAEARVAENEAAYSVLVADADGTIVEALGEPGQVVSAGQTVIRLAQAGPREALISLPETIRPAIGSTAQASVYGSGGRRLNAQLRQLSDSADVQTRTYEARYVLEGEAAAAPFGATVTIWIATKAERPEVQVPLGAVLDDGKKTGVWVLEASSSTVKFRPVRLAALTSESAVVSGVTPDDTIVSLGAHLLQDGARVRSATNGGHYK